MKKKAAIVTIIITSVIIWVLTALAVGLNFTQDLSYTETVKEAGSAATTVKKSVRSVTFLPVGKNCEFEITTDGPEEIVTTVSISTDSAKAEPIFETTTSNMTVKTGKLNVDNKDIYVNFQFDSLSELDIDKEYAVRCTIILNPSNYAIYRGIMIAVATLCIIPLGISISYLFSLAENNEKAYDERQMRMRGKAAMSTLIVVIISALALGFMSLIYNGFPLSVYDSMIIVVFIGLATFAITADRNDAYMRFKGKRLPFAIPFTIIGIIDIVIFICNVRLMITGAATENQISSIVQGICCLAIGIELITQNIKDKKEAEADEES